VDFGIFDVLHGLKLIVHCSVSLRFMLVKLAEIRKEVQCPICLGENILSQYALVFLLLHCRSLILQFSRMTEAFK
jgi:hypothetical protein